MRRAKLGLIQSIFLSSFPKKKNENAEGGGAVEAGIILAVDGGTIFAGPRDASFGATRSESSKIEISNFTIISSHNGYVCST